MTASELARKRRLALVDKPSFSAYLVTGNVATRLRARRGKVRSSRNLCASNLISILSCKLGKNIN